MPNSVYIIDALFESKRGTIAGPHNKGGAEAEKIRAEKMASMVKPNQSWASLGKKLELSPASVGGLLKKYGIQKAMYLQKQDGLPAPDSVEPGLSIGELSELFKCHHLTAALWAYKHGYITTRTKDKQSWSDFDPEPGLTATELADIYGIRHPRKWAKSNGYSLKVMRNKIEGDVRPGLTADQIAKEYGVTRAGAVSWARRNGYSLKFAEKTRTYTDVPEPGLTAKQLIDRCGITNPYPWAKRRKYVIKKVTPGPVPVGT